MFKAAAAFTALALVAGSAAAQDVSTPNEASWREVPAQNLLVIDTTKGRVLVEMAPAVAPKHVERISMLARQGFYNGIRWHRVIDYFMAQTGDPLGTGDGQSTYPDLPLEVSFWRTATSDFTPVASPAGSMVGFVGSLPVKTQPDSLMQHMSGDPDNGIPANAVRSWGLYCPGVAGMARGTAEDSANSQFFLMRQPYPSLEMRYTVWGRVVSGLDVVRTLKTGAPGSGSVTDPDVMTRVQVASDMSELERPSVRVLDTRSPAFETLVQSVKAQRGADFSMCDIDLPVQVYQPAS